MPNLLVTQASKGFKLDLSKNTINGYDLYLKGTNTVTGKTFLLDSGAPELPLMIGEKFNVSWDGVLTCNKFNALSTDGTTDNAISINNNFYVTKSGGAGGGSANFGYGGFGSISCGKLNANSGEVIFDSITTKTFNATGAATFQSGIGVSGIASFVNGGIAISGASGSFSIGNDSFGPTDITSNDGTVYVVLGHKQKGVRIQ